MSVSAEIYWAIGLTPDEAARTIVRVVGDCHLRYADAEPDVPLVYRQAPGRPEWIGGPVTHHYPSVPLEGESQDDPAWQIATDYYPIEWLLHRYPKDEQALRREAEQLFEGLADRVSDPLMLTFDLDRLLRARLRGEAVIVFPEGTSPYADHHDLWLPYRLDPRFPG